MSEGLLGLMGNFKSYRNHLSWSCLQRLKARNSMPWLCARYFNEISRSHEKLGGRLRPVRSKSLEMCWMNVDFVILVLKGESLRGVMVNLMVLLYGNGWIERSLQWIG